MPDDRARLLLLQDRVTKRLRDARHRMVSDPGGGRRAPERAIALEVAKGIAETVLTLYAEEEQRLQGMIAVIHALVAEDLRLLRKQNPVRRN